MHRESRQKCDPADVLSRGLPPLPAILFLCLTTWPWIFYALLHRPTVCPSNDSANILSYQELPTSIQLWRGHGQEAKRGDAGGHRITRNLKRLGRFSSHMRPRDDPARGVVPERCTSSGAAVDARRDPTAWVRRAECAANGGAVDVPRALSVPPRAP
jgi:hypothetical protein